MANDFNILNRIQVAFNEVQSDKSNAGREYWTSKFLGKLEKIGESLNYKVYPDKDKESKSKIHGEWMFDLCWSMEGANPDDWMTKYQGLKLICESEWSLDKGAILYDFQKLAVAKADIKIMITQYNQGTTYEMIREWCERSVDRSLYEDGSTYILVGSGNGDKDTTVRFEKLW